MLQKLKTIFSRQDVFLIFGFFLTSLIYLPALNGTPIWDDYHYIFAHKVIFNPEFKYGFVIENYVWFVSMVLEKFLYGFWKEDFFYYHLLNLLLHFLNSFLLFRLLRKFEIPFARWVFVIFLIHPSNVMTVAWMVQLKTLICFTFAILSVFTFLKARDDKRYYPLSWILFALSLFSKSASLPLTAFFIYSSFDKKNLKPLLWILPFLLLSSLSIFRILNSDETKKSQTQAESKTYVYDDRKVENKTPETKPAPPSAEVTAKEKDSQVTLFFQTVYFYFWQATLPLENYPVKGEAFKPGTLLTVIHLLFICSLFILSWKSVEALYLLATYIMLTPFLGFLIAPYMSLTWVSDQHLYLVLPFLILFWLGSIWKLNYSWKAFLPLPIVLFFFIRAMSVAHYYKDDIIFYTESLKADAKNIPINYNLAVAYLRRNDLKGAMKVTEEVLDTPREELDSTQLKYLPYIEELHEKMEKALHKP